MLDILLDTLLDALKILPFLFITYLIMEYIEHKMSSRTKRLVEKSGNYGPLIGGLLGAFPQCRFFCVWNKFICCKNYYTWDTYFYLFINFR